MTPEESCAYIVRVIMAEKKKRGIGKKKMAQLCGVAPTTIARWDKGESCGNLYAMATALDRLGYEIGVRRKKDGLS